MNGRGHLTKRARRGKIIGGVCMPLWCGRLARKAAETAAPQNGPRLVIREAGTKSVSRLTTIVCALSAIVTIVDYVTAKPLIAHWLARQATRTPDGWQISPVLNAVVIASMAGMVWMMTGADTPANDVHAVKRLLRLRMYLIGCGLGLWFFFGPAIGTPPPAVKSAGPAAPARESAREAFAAAPTAGPRGMEQHVAANRMGRDARFRSVPDAPQRGWRPGDGLRMMANLIEGWVNPPTPEPPRIGR